MKMRTVLLLLLATLLVAACGNKGPLVLPDKTDADAVYQDDDTDGEADDGDGEEPPGDGGR